MKLLAHVEMKAERAEGHLNALRTIMRPVLEEPHTVIAREDREKSLYIRRTLLKDIPDVAAMLLGEFLYCLRSGLDQLAWQLALPEAKRDTPRDIYFPIFSRVSNGDERRKVRKALSLFPSDVAAEIDRVQPYKGPGALEDHPLWQLHRLCNLDKHCIVPFSCTNTQVFYPRNGVATVLDAENAIEVSVPIEQKAELDAEPNATCQIELGEWDSDFSIPFRKLADMHDFVRNTVLPLFSRFDVEITASPPYRTEGPIKIVRTS